MNQVQSVAITKAGVEVFRFVSSDNFERAAYLAGTIMDRLADYHGGDDWDYQVTATPYASGITSDRDVINMALSKVTF